MAGTVIWTDLQNKIIHIPHPAVFSSGQCLRLWKMVVPTPVNSLQTGLLLPGCFTEQLCSMGRYILPTVRTHVTTCAVPFWPWCCEYSFSEAWFLAHTFRSNYFYISVHVLADTQGKKKQKKKQMSRFLNESWWQGIRLVSHLCFAHRVILLLLTFSISLSGAGSGRAMGQARCFATLSCSADTICAGTVQAGDISTAGFTNQNRFTLGCLYYPKCLPGLASHDDLPASLRWQSHDFWAAVVTLACSQRHENMRSWHDTMNSKVHLETWKQCSLLKPAGKFGYFSFFSFF